MGNALSNSTVDKPNKKSLSQIIDYVATNYILTQNFKDMEKLTDTDYCNNLVILTSKIVDQKLSNLEISYLTQRLKGKSEINEMASDKLIYFKKDQIDSFDVQNVQNATQKRRMCIGIAKFYVKVAQVFSAIVTTVNPTYKFKDISGNSQEVDLSQKETIPDEAKASIQRINMCSQRINALINGQNFNPNQKEPVKVNPKFCEINTDSKTGKSRNLYSEPGMPELEKLYFDKYDYDHGGFVGMTEKMRKTVYEKDVETLYKAFTGNDKIPLDDKGEKTIKTFTQIPLRNYKNSEGCSPGGKYTKAYEGSLKEKLFYEYASHINDMMNNVNTNQSKLLALIDRLFSFNINPLTKKKEIVVKASLTEKKLEDIVVETRTIIQDLYKNCELDFLKGLKIVEDIINKTIKDTTLIQIKQLEEKRDIILTEGDLDKIKEDKPVEVATSAPAIEPANATGPANAIEPAPATASVQVIASPEPANASPEPAHATGPGSANPSLPKTLVPFNIVKETISPITIIKPTGLPAQSVSPSPSPSPFPRTSVSPSPSPTPFPRSSLSQSPEPSPEPNIPVTPMPKSSLLVPQQQLKTLKISSSDIPGTPPPRIPLEISSPNIPGTPPPNIPLIRVSSVTNTFPVYLKEAGSDGNCFFNSIYDAANEQGLLERIYNAYNTTAKPVDKISFVKYIRDLVAKKINQDDTGLRTAYELLEDSDIKNKIKLEENKAYILNDFQPWFIQLYKDSKNYEEFKMNVTNTIRNSSNYTQGLEYGITEDLLEYADIEIESHMFDNTKNKDHGITELNKFNNDTIPVIHLLNETFNNGHFKYFSFIKPVEPAQAVGVAQKTTAQAPAIAVSTPKPLNPQEASKAVAENKKWWQVWKGGKKTKRNHNKSIKNIKHKKTKRRV